MGRLLKYAIFLALTVAGAAYVVLGAVSLEDIFPDHPQQEALTGSFEPTPPKPSASIDEELDFMVAKRLASLERWRTFLAAHPDGAYAQSARVEVEKRLSAEEDSREEPPAAARALTSSNYDSGYDIAQKAWSLAASYGQSAKANVERLLFAEKVPAPANAEIRNGAAPAANGATRPTDGVLPAPEDAVHTPGPTAAPNDASPDGTAANETRPRVTPPAGTDLAAGTQLAALTPDEICQRDGDRLARLHLNPSPDEAQRFATELGCEKLRSQVLGLMESPPPPRPAADASTAVPADMQAVNEAARVVPPRAGANVAALTSDQNCKRDEDRLARLRARPSGEEAQRFASELGCEALRPQFERLMESQSSPAPAPPANSSLTSNGLLAQVCVTERAALDRLRKEPSAEAAGLFWRDLKCESLRPQVRLLMESFNVAPETLSSAAARNVAAAYEGGASDAPTPNGGDPAACRIETAELNRLRAMPDAVNARRFAAAVTCDALKPQAARLLESLKD
jgi:hypothetical protein